MTVKKVEKTFWFRIYSFKESAFTAVKGDNRAIYTRENKTRLK